MELVESLLQNEEAIISKLQALATTEISSKTLGGQTVSSIIQELVTAFASQLQGTPQALINLVARFSRQTVLAADPVDNLRLLLDRMLEVAIITVFQTSLENANSKELKGFSEPVDAAKTELINVALQTQQEIISKQNQALLELSTPVIPIFDHILVLPLIGSIDTQRGKQIMDNLLEGIVSSKAEVVLIDISGVPIVDTQVAHHIIKTVQAAKLLGARCILVGIRPEFAQTIVKLGIDFHDIVTKNSLQAGLELALSWNNIKLQLIEE